MANLLPPEDQRRIKHDRIKKLIVVVSFGVALVFAAGILLLLPLFFSLRFQKASFVEQLETVKQKPVFAQVENIEKSIDDLNVKLQAFQSNQDKTQNISPVLVELFSLADSSININSLAFTNTNSKLPPQLSIRGVVDNRDNLLEFIDLLEQSPFFSAVNSPLTNLLKEFDIEFSLTLNIDETKI